MRTLFAIVLIALLLGVGIVAVIETDPGYVLVSYGNLTLETSLWVGLLLLLLLDLFIYLVIRLVYRIASGQRSLFSWMGARKARNALRLSNRGLISFTEGNWVTARRQLLRGAENNEAPFVNYLLAAKSSAQLQDTEKLHEYLREASDAEPAAVVAVEFALAEMNLQAGEYAEAVAALDQATRNVGRHPYVLSLLSQAYQGLKDWDKMLELLPQLQKHKVLGADDFQQLEQQVHYNRLEQGGTGAEELRGAWQQVPRHLQRTPEMVAEYVRRLIKAGEHDMAAKAIQSALKHEWHGSLLREYGYVESNDNARQLAAAERWLVDHPEDPQLLLCLGRLSARDKLWGKARDYFESSYRLERSAEICAELGRLLTGLGEPKVAAAYFREGLLLQQDQLPELPMPEKMVPDNRLLA